MQKVTAAYFKAHCLQYMDLARDRHETVIITKRGKPVAKLVPYEIETPQLLGRMRGTATIIATHPRPPMVN